MEAVPTAQDTSCGANSSSIKSDDSSPHNDRGPGSPPPNCAICLGACRNKSFTDSCLHQFCFKCLLTWSKVKAECPLCKQNFRSIIHNVRSNHQYEEYMVEQRQTEEIAERIDLDSIVNATRRFRYRTTLTLPRRETIAIQQLLLRYPSMADVFPVTAHRRRSPASFRRTVYRYNLWARPLPDFTGRFRDCTPEFYRYNESQTTRLVPWLNRELQYLLNENAGHISYVISRILLLLPQYHINSSEFRDTLRRYFGERTDHFLHELYCFASTPYDMTGYDRNVQYTTDTRVSTMVNEVISSSESDASAESDIVIVPNSESTDLPPGPSRAPTLARAPVYPQNYIHQPTSTSTPAPTTVPSATPSSSNIIPIETISQSDTDDDSSEVMVVGYIKPPQDRTPEVVDLLGSDSDVIVQDAVPSPPAQDSQEDSQETRSAALVMLTLRSHNARQRDSDSDSVYMPSLTAPPLLPRRRRISSSSNASTVSSLLSYKSENNTRLESVSGDITCGSCSNDTIEDTESSDCDTPPRKQRRLDAYIRERSKRRWTPPRRKSRASLSSSREKKRKSSSGRGVKISKTASTSVKEEQPETLDRAGPSGTSSSGKHRGTSRDTKRLKSVVKIINNQKNSGESSSKSGLSPRKRDRRADPRSRHKRPADTEDSDSEDNLPLNLTIGASSTT